MAETELARAEKRYAQAKARLKGLKNREAARQRKMDTRRKVILGGALLDLAARDSGAAAMLDRLIRNLSRDQDRKAFVEWDGASGGVANGISSDGTTGVSYDGPGGVTGGTSDGGLDSGLEDAPQSGSGRELQGVSGGMSGDGSDREPGNDPADAGERSS